jgi:hypothetical protein
MTITTLSSRQFNQDASKTKKATADPVFIQRRSDGFISVSDNYQELEINVLLAGRRDSLQGAVFSSSNGYVLVVDAAVAQLSAKLHVPEPRPSS